MLNYKRWPARRNTTILMEMVDQGVLSAESVVEMCLSYMSEQDVTDMMEANDLMENEEE